jgi:hypothetical protein
MNDQIKLLVAGATIGIVGAAAGGIVVAWALKADSTARVATASSPQRMQMVSTPNSSTFRPPSFGTNAPPKRAPQQFTMPSGATGFSTGRPQPVNPAVFQKVQEQPEVKKARDEFMEAQKRYLSAMQTAMGKTDATASTSKSVPLTVQTPPATPSTSGATQPKPKQ